MDSTLTQIVDLLRKFFIAKDKTVVKKQTRYRNN